MTLYNTYVLYLDSNHSSINFDSIDNVKEYVAETTGVNVKQVAIEKDVNVHGYSNISINNKFDDLIRVVGVVCGLNTERGITNI